MRILVVLAFLAVPLAHQIHGHRIHRKGLRAVLSHRCPEVPATRHELAHAARSRPVQALANAAWLAYMAAVIVFGLVLHGNFW